MVDKVWLPQRWDVGLWDQAVWDGQLGFNAVRGQITVTSYSATFVLGHLLSAATAAIVVNGIDAALLSGRSFPVEPGSIVISGQDTKLTRAVRMQCLAAERSNIKVSGCWANLTVFRQPGELNFGIPRRVVSGRL